MDIKTIQELAKIIALCRKKGVETCKITADSVEMTFKEQPQKVRNSKKNEEHASFEDPYSPMDKLFWSSAGIPGEAS